MDSGIVVDHLIKNFEVVKKKPGLFGSFSSLVSLEKKTVRALKGVSFKLEEGELVGFIGPNGAGKTTTLKILSGILHPTSGFVQVIGFTPWERSPYFLKQISLVMGQKNQLWWDLPAVETFNLHKAIYQIPDKIYAESLDELVKLLEVKDLLQLPVRRLSLGQRMRLELVVALLHQPKVVFLDEPTIGLDLVAQQRMREFIRDYNRQKKATILLTSHNMDDLVGLCDRVIMIDKGEIIFDGQLSQLVNRFARKKIIKISLAQESNYKDLEKIGKIKNIDLPRVEMAVPRSAAPAAAAEILQNFPITDLTIEEESIEAIIRKVFKEGISRKKR